MDRKTDLHAAAQGSTNAGDGDALERRIRFALEADRLKSVIRRTRLVDGSRRENSAEHSWHLALLAVLLADTAGPGVDAARVVRMLLVHDVVEVEAGDTFAYDVDANLGRDERERLAAERTFGLLPAEQGGELRALWEEFEAGESADARFAVALDRFQPLLLNFYGGGGSWLEHGIARAQVLRRMAPIEHGAPALWPFVVRTIDRACAEGWIAPDP
ncbi:HD domain-containing protein [Longimicrobium sp.]|uniref:HD domain-containing protein n=1 Tax=Longimicrobium sp. TaxID=2029185 RepID=UPI002C108753|nr:HD domain-containing protein [Longimicrobium sp.]HSU15385.1 HD domain-containing protein [Longimicrobium sp.]